jgi:hypothetical protein
LPKGQAEREALAEQIGRDGLRVLTAIYAPAAPPWLRTVPAVETLRQVWLQQYYAPQDAGPPRWRTGDDVPPASQMINSPHDVDARYTYKRSTSWIGYKAHLTETCDPDAPHLITHVETTPAPTPDRDHLPTIHHALAAKDLLPREHLVDAGYVDGETLASSHADHGVAVIGPVPADQQWQAQAGTGFDVSCFAIDWDARCATCPAGRASVGWSTSTDRCGKEMINIQFAGRDCQACPHRAACTTARGGRRLSVAPKRSIWPCRRRASTRRHPRSKRSTTRAQGWKAPFLRGCGSVTCTGPAISAWPRRTCSTCSRRPPSMWCA